MPTTLKKLATWLADNELLLLGLAAPFLLFPGLFGLPAQFSPWIGLGIAGLAWVGRGLAQGRLSVATPLDLPILLLVGLAGMGYAISIVPELSWSRLWSLVFGLLVYYAFANWTRDTRRLRQALWLLGLLTLAICGLSLVGTDWDKVRMVDLPWLYDRLPTLLRGLPGSGVEAGGELFNPRWVGITLGFLAPLFLALFWFGGVAARPAGPVQGSLSPAEQALRAATLAKGKGVIIDPNLRWLCGAVLAACLVMLLLTQALQGLVAFIAGTAFLLFWRTAPQWRWAWVVLPLNLLALGLYFWVDRLPALAVYLLSPSNPVGIAVSLRLDIWSRALAMLQDLPFSGIGLNAFQAMQVYFYPGYALGLEPHAHNLYLQTALDFGLPGLFVFFWLVVAWFVAVYRRYAVLGSQERLLLMAFSASLVGYLAHGFLDGMMLGAKPSFALWWVLGLGIATPPGILSLRRPKPANLQARFKRGLLTWLPLLVLLAGVLFYFQCAPASLPMNQGALQAQRQLVRIATGQTSDPAALAQAQAKLSQAIALDPQRVFAYELLGLLEGWLGNPDQALLAYQARVALDARREKPLRFYAPQAYWLRRLQASQGSPPGPLTDLGSVYQNWLVRYPNQLNHSLRMAIFLNDYMNNPALARQVLEAARQRNAQPGAVLEKAFDSLFAR